MAWDDHYILRITINTAPLYLEGSQKSLPFQTLLHLPEGRHQVVMEAVNLVSQSTKRTVIINVDR
jgi:hypothetical protein